MVITGPATAKPGDTVRFKGSCANCTGISFDCTMNGATVHIAASNCAGGNFWFEVVVPAFVPGELNLLEGTVTWNGQTLGHTVVVTQ